MPVVVAAYQSPTLFNILAKSSEWDMYMAPMGDHGGLKEMDLKEVPTWKGSMPQPDVVMVCSPAQLMFAEHRFPGAAKVWVFHNGRQRHLLSRGDESRVVAGVAFSETVSRLQGSRSIWVFPLSPAYEANPVWSWTADRFWKLRNRPATRIDDFDTVASLVFRGLNLGVYGQNQDLGFATPEKRAELMRSCSGYASCLGRSAGFGLAEHECLAAGVPIVGGWWGDTRNEMRDYYGLNDDIMDIRAVAKLLSTSEDFATELSERGLDYIRTCRTKKRMDKSIRTFLDRLL